MKYALVNNLNGFISRILDAAPAPERVREGVTVVEITDELATAYADSLLLEDRTEHKLYLIEGLLKTAEEARVIRSAQRRAEQFTANPVLFKDRLIRKAQAKRNADILGGFEFGGNHFQTRNPIDVQNIMNVGLGAGADPSFTTNFRSTDNTWVSLDNDQCKAFYAAMLAAGAAIWAAFGAKEAEILAATTLAELDAIEI